MDHASNRLGRETSPYLLQHASNPVHWQPWDGAALAAAREQNKPILLSIGYSACHWCHVMAHESFEDQATAARMNELFVNIKVDREERPDLDRVYQLAHQMLVQRPGGWPLTMFLTPDTLTPFFGGTYFPPDARHGLPAFTDLLDRVATYFRQHGEEINAQAEAIREVFTRIESANKPADHLDSKALGAAREKLAAIFDARCGGFGKAPRFPNAAALERLLRHWRASALMSEPDMDALYMSALTLRRMADGGINDQLAGGFCRYSVDDYWMIPHFEKMLYDNALLLPIYAWAGQATGEQLFVDTTIATAGWMLEEMRSPEGGFYAALDADSEGEEGRFYAWEKSAIRELLDDQQFAVVAKRFGLDREPNFEGRWHLHVFADFPEIAADLEMDEKDARAHFEKARKVLLNARNQRERPGLDDKILTGWNGLAIGGLSVAATALQEPAYAEAAKGAADFLRSHCWHSGRLLASWRAGRARFPAYLDDYAFVGLGLVRLLQASWRSCDLEFAVALADTLIEHFEDKDHGGFFFTGDDHEQLIHRPKPFSDDATPSGNAVAASFLNILGHLLGQSRYVDAAERSLKAASETMNQIPEAHCSFLNALEDHLAPLEIIVIRGEGDELDLWRETAQAIYLPARLVFAIPGSEENLPGLLGERKATGGTVAYCCRGMTCKTPVHELSELTSVLNETMTGEMKAGDQ
ncbi:MAG: thioredoxin domain-containing protein [Gammaproteobacteria bacterium]|nr:thioredoxin domain-containing protein [Gammaproteobacteria bacterium]